MKFKARKDCNRRLLKLRGYEDELIELETVGTNPALLFIDVGGVTQATLEIKKAVKMAKAILKEFGE